MAILSAVIDSREPADIQALTFGGAPTLVMPLDAGDLIITTDAGDILGIERKTASDYLNTLRDERLFSQLVKLRELTPWAYLAICGTLAPGPEGKCYQDGHETGWKWASVAGSLLTVQEIGVHILFVANAWEFEQAVIRLAARERTAVRVKPVRDAAIMGDGEAILTALPGIGAEKAQSLLAYCGTPAWALVYLSNDAWDGPGVPLVGDGTRQRIRRALELPAWALLAIVTRDDEKEVAFRSPEGVSQ